MDNNLIRDMAAGVLLECNVHNFPIDCIEILMHYGFRVYTYDEISSTNARLLEMCRKYSDDAFTYQDIVCYNQNALPARTLFSLMHELGHYILKHEESTSDNEAEADYFASCMLAPRVAIQRLQCKTALDIHERFGLSIAASNRALAHYQKLYCRCLSDQEKILMEHLFPLKALTPERIVKHAPKKKHKTRHPKQWAALEERNRFIEEHFCNMDDYAIEQYETKKLMGLY